MYTALKHYMPYGFSLIEMLFALCLLAVLSGFALINMPQWARKHQADATIGALRSGINIARHTAINKNTDVIVCPNDNGDCGPRNTWHTGTLIFEDKDRSRHHSQGDVIVAHLPAIDHGRIYWRAFRNRSYLLFTGRGITDWQNGHFIYCPHDSDPQLARQLVLNYAGRTYLSKDLDGDGIHQDGRGRTLTCPR